MSDVSTGGCIEKVHLYNKNSTRERCDHRSEFLTSAEMILSSGGQMGSSMYTLCVCIMHMHPADRLHTCTLSCLKS